MNKNIILARYNEDIDWIYDCKDFANIFIINKGSRLFSKRENVKIIETQNVGREAETYFYFIVNFYDFIIQNKTSLFIFSQAHPFDNNENFLELVKSLNYENQYPYGLSNNKGKENINLSRYGDPAHPNGLPILNFINHLFFTDSYLHLNSVHDVVYNGLWATTGSSILFRKKIFYDHCLNLSNPSKNPIEAYIFERIWQYIFDQRTLDWFSHYQEIRKKYINGVYRNEIIT